MATATAALTLAEECYARAAEAGFTKRELSSLKRILAKKNVGQILAAISKLSEVNGFEEPKAIGLLYSLTGLSAQ